LVVEIFSYFNGQYQHGNTLASPLPEDSQLEHHLYVSADYFIDVLSERQPIIMIKKDNSL